MLVYGSGSPYKPGSLMWTMFCTNCDDHLSWHYGDTEGSWIDLGWHGKDLDKAKVDGGSNWYCAKCWAKL